MVSILYLIAFLSGAAAAFALMLAVKALRRRRYLRGDGDGFLAVLNY